MYISTILTGSEKRWVTGSEIYKSSTPLRIRTKVMEFGRGREWTLLRKPDLHEREKRHSL